MTLGWFVLLSCCALLLYATAAYPAILARMAHSSPAVEPPRPEPLDTAISVIVPVYNGAKHLRATLQAILESDYPKSLTQVLVVSDASTDATNQVAEEYSKLGVELFVLGSRIGKVAAQHAAQARLTGDVIINVDVSTRPSKEAIRLMVAALAEDSVGVATGRDVSEAGVEQDYIDLEMRVRKLETELGGTVAASGCLYGMRREVFAEPMASHCAGDFAAVLIARRLGLRTVAVENALSYVPPSTSFFGEFQRKVRTIGQGITTLAELFEFRWLWQEPLFAWMLVSHKVVRWAVPCAVALAAAIVGVQWPLVTVALICGIVASATFYEIRPANGVQGSSGFRTLGRLSSLTISTCLATFLAIGLVATGRRFASWSPTARLHSQGND